MRVMLILILVANVLLTGCASEKAGVVLDPAGPSPATAPGADAAVGTLLVYTAYDAGADFNSRDPYRPVCTDYRIYTTAGKLLQKVHNNSDSILQSPIPVALPSGQYRITAKANGYVHDISIAVVIEPRQTTVLHLEGGGFGEDEGAFNNTNSVRLPNGIIIGWKASVATLN